MENARRLDSVQDTIVSLDDTIQDNRMGQRNATRKDNLGAAKVEDIEEHAVVTVESNEASVSVKVCDEHLNVPALHNYQYEI